MEDTHGEPDLLLDKENESLRETSAKDDHSTVQCHPLHTKWALWYLKGDKTKEWEDCLMKVATIATVEEFWA